MGWWYSRCDNEAGPVARALPLENRSWEWSSTCGSPVQPLSGSRFCSWLRDQPGRGVLVVGDSLSDVFASTFAAAMGPMAGGERTRSQGSKVWPICEVALNDTDAVCRRGPRCPLANVGRQEFPKRLTFIRNDVLDVSPQYPGELLNVRGYKCAAQACRPHIWFGLLPSLSYSFVN